IFQGGGGAGQATEAKNTIIGAVVGLALALGSYTVLNLINPDLVTFKALRLEIVDREEFSLGFSYADPTPEQEEGVIAEPATSTPSGGTSRDKLLSVCKSRSAGGTVTASDLKAILKTWIDIGTVGGATYIRGGFTKQSACTNNAQKDYALKILNDQGIKIPEGAAHEDLKQLYQQEIVDKVFEDGRLCGDCVSWTQQLFECAGMGYQLRFPAMKSRKEQYLKYRISTSDNSCAEARDNIPGGIKFGDIIHYRNLSDAGHMVTYIGDNGISGLEDYEIVEMGGAKSAKCEIVKGLNNALNCVRIHKTWSGWNKKKKFCDIFRVLGN
ncbi:hypothetical protein KJ969_02870, partial [Patescibacteria group bacterium]|nr:hypothetical protein [Patescibacteria group bacterium]MBU1922383.1 hypothetical protein [Patescibacteria group bacterium]